jgi:hypothetical protein
MKDDLSQLQPHHMVMQMAVLMQLQSAGTAQKASAI